MFAVDNGEDAYLNAQRSKELAIFKGFKAIICSVDVTDAQSVQNMIDRALQEFGRIDYCVNSAGVNQDNTRLNKGLY